MTTNLAPFPLRARVTDENGIATREFQDYLTSSFQRLGGYVAPTNAELASAAASSNDSLVEYRRDPLTQEAMRSVDELRSEIASTRNECDGLRRLISEQENELQTLRPLADLRQRVERIEGILI